MILLNNSERAIVIGRTTLVPTVPREMDETVLENARVKELLAAKDIVIVEEAQAT